MNNRKLSIALGIIVTVISIVSVLVLFATAFGKSGEPAYPSTLGSCYQVAFGAHEYNAVPLLIAGFILQCVAILFGLVSAFLPGKGGLISFGLTGLLLAIAGIFWVLAPSSFSGMNTITPAAEVVVHGTGTILAMVFCFLGALLAFYGAYRTAKN